MDAPSISLIIVQGPRKGETIGFQSGSTIRVGRVVRGNNLSIQDAGISSKHFTIESESGKWILRDLGSCNGTTLNSNVLPAKTPFDLHDGDTVKLGETTSILIKIDGGQGGGEEVQMVESRRRNPARRGRALKSETENLERKENVRVTRSRKNEESVNCELVIPKAQETEGKRRRGRPRGRKKNQQEEKLEEKDRIIFSKDEVHEEGELNSLQKEEISVIKDEENVENSKNEVKESCDERVEVDLEKMTLGEWFDYLELHLPKQIIEASEEMIEGLKKKAERVKEYILEQKTEKGKAAVV